MTNAILRGKPDAGNPHVRFDEGEVASAKPRRGSLLYKDSIVKVHTKDGRELYLNANYIVRYSDGLVVADDWVYSPDCKIPESKNSYVVFETADEISGQIQGAVRQGDLDRKYQEDFLLVKEKRRENVLF